MKLFFTLAIIAVSFANALFAQKQNKTVYISGNSNTGDTVIIEFWDQNAGGNRNPAFKKRVVERVVTKDTFAFRFDNITRPAHFSLMSKPFGKDAFIYEYLIMPGDSVYVERGDKGSACFTGKGSAAMACRFSMDSAYLKGISYKVPVYPNTYLQRKEVLLYLQCDLSRTDSGRVAKLRVLEKRKALLTPLQYQVLQADIIGACAIQKYETYIRASGYLPKDISEDSVNHIKEGLDRFRKEKIFLEKTNLPDEALTLSSPYVNAVIALTLLESKAADSKPGYQLILDRYKGVLRDQLLAIYLHRNALSIASVDAVMRDCLKLIKTDYWKNAVEFTLAHYSKGVTAYDFRLEDTDGKMRSLSDFRGKRVVIDYWFTGCTGCTQFYAAALKEVENSFRRDTSILFISIANDADRKTWLESIKKDIYTSSSILNLKTSDMGSDDPFVKKNALIGAPSLIIVDEKGKIFYNGFPPRDVKALTALIKNK